MRSLGPGGRPKLLKNPRNPRCLRILGIPRILRILRVPRGGSKSFGSGGADPDF